jgi:hypothetical protein
LSKRLHGLRIAAWSMVLAALPFASALAQAPRDAQGPLASRRIALSFEGNLGQLPLGAHVHAFGTAMPTYLKRDGTTVVRAASRVPKSMRSKAAVQSDGAQDGGTQITVQLLRSNPSPSVEMGPQVKTRSHYLLGNDPSKWIVNVPHYASVRYRDVYPGIDQVFHGSTGELEYDLVVAPNADPAVIRLAVTGAGTTALSSDGGIAFETPHGSVVQKRPIAYQEDSAGKTFVDASYELTSAGEIALKLGAYDRQRTLTIDPVIVYSTLFANYGVITGMTVDADGAAFIVGTISGSSLALVDPAETITDIPGTYQHSSFSSADNIFVAKIAPEGDHFEYATLLGSSQDDRAGGIAITPNGEAIIGAITLGTDYPVVKPFSSTALADPAAAVFNVVSRLSADGSTLRYSYYHSVRATSNGFDLDYGADPRVAVSPSGVALVAAVGSRSGTRAPIAPAIETSYHCGTVLLTRIAADSSREDATVCLAGSFVSDLAVDPSGSAYVTGIAASEFYSKGPISPVIPAPTQFDAGAWVTKLNPAGDTVIYHATFGGRPNQGGTSDKGVAVAADQDGNTYLTGFTSSPLFPLVNVRDLGLTTRRLSPGTGTGFFNAFVTKINPGGTAIVYSTFLNLNLNPLVQPPLVSGIAVDTTGHAYVAGIAGRYSGAFVGVDAYTLQDAFVAKLDNQGRAVLSDYRLGGTSGEASVAFARGPNGHLYLAGLTCSPDYPQLGTITGWQLFFGDTTANCMEFAGRLVEDPPRQGLQIAALRNPTPIRNPVIFSASVPDASGHVNWFIDDALSGVVELAAGKRDVTYSPGALKLGMHDVRAVYVPDDTTLQTLSASLTQQVALPEDCR